MALTKIVNGVEVLVDPAEELDIQSEWDANDPTLSDNVKARKLARVKDLYARKKQQLENVDDRLVVLSKAFKIIAKYVTITDPQDQTDLLALKNKYQELTDLDTYATLLKANLEIDPINTDVEAGWPV